MEQHQFIALEVSDDFFTRHIQGLRSQLLIWLGPEDRGRKHLRNNSNCIPTERCHNLDDFNPKQHRCENTKSRETFFYFCNNVLL